MVPFFHNFSPICFLLPVDALLAWHVTFTARRVIMFMPGKFLTLADHTNLALLTKASTTKYLSIFDMCQALRSPL